MASPAPSPPLRIAVVGAGTAGLLLAVLLQRRGHRVTLFEKAPAPRTDGCGILLVRDGVEAIAAAGVPGVLDAVLDGGNPVRRYVFRNLKGGEIGSHPVERAPGELPALLIHRRILLEALWAAFDPADFHGGASLLSCDQGDDHACASFGDGTLWEGDLLIGADGLFSTLASTVAPERRLNYLGDRVWRGLVADAAFCTGGDFLVYARGRGIYANVFDLGRDAAGTELTHWGFFNEEPLPSSREERRRRLAEPIPEEALAKLPADAAALIRSTPPGRVVANYTHDIDPLPRLVRGRLALIGDAAHAMSSSQARGMTAGFEDAVSLAEHLGAPHHDWRTALAAYESERLPVVHRYQRNSREVSSRTGRRRPAALSGRRMA
jgi:2-polyprenyl-6-methoxyphenol hydroxylase-like FAD-dependent oxidoreductase